MIQLGNPGYILCISMDDWLEQVFRINKYYTGIMRDYKRGTPILLAMKAAGRDSFVGYGIVDKVEMLWEMPLRSTITGGTSGNVDSPSEDSPDSKSPTQ